MSTITKVQFYPNEEFREITMPTKMRLRYAISNKGRLLSYEDDMKFGRILKGSLTDGYRLFKYKIYTEDKKMINKHLFFSRLVAEYFLKKENDNQIFVLHLDRVRDNDDVRNLRWATKEEMMEHSKNSPFVKQAKKNLLEFNIKRDGRKLTSTDVIRIKKTLARKDQPTRMRIIAKQFGVSEMQIYRIKTGENWGHIKI
ncbi:HNH endonuclease [Flavobacterium sp. SUN052]|uniref:HNH endonuclease n=1 Tax=Flavobacterium sp. SUN052 TaxID=3002441 RepID=UPI00237ECCCC|nr:HNH endonuclease [Flavobacterium sp. SUN052]MEC4003785.1 HNH endonuclease [Flavobacterium sp. SUN052]